MTIRVAFLDEAVLFPRIFIEQVFSRTDSFGNNAKIIMSTNPAGDTSHWYYKTYIKNADKYISITTEEAGIVDYETIEKNRKTLGEGTFKQRYLAQWVGANNDSAFPNFVPTYCEERSKWLLNNPDRKSWQAQHLIVDTGFKDSVAIMEITQVNDLSIVSYLDYHSSRETGIHLTSIDVVNEIVSLYNTQQYDSVLIDSNLDMVEQLRRRGVSVAKSIGGKDRERQWRRTSTLLNSGKLLFAEDVDKIIIEQIKNAKMDKDGKRIGKVDNNTVSESEQIHALDCLVYYALLLWRE
jgi:hypothetical protein